MQFTKEALVADTTFLQADLREREETDRQISFWLAFLLGILTLGLYSYYVIWQLVSRRDRHFRRIARLAEDATVYLRARAEAAGTDIGERLVRLEAAQRPLRESAAERGALIWTILCFVSQGVGSFVLWYVLMADFRQHEQQEEQLVSVTNEALVALGENPGLVSHPQVPERSYWLYLFLTIITLGLFSVYWYYCLIEDPNRHFGAQAEWEARLVRAAG